MEEADIRCEERRIISGEGIKRVVISGNRKYLKEVA